MLKICLVSSFLIISLAATSAEKRKLQPHEKDRVMSIIDELIDTTHPDLDNGKRIKVKLFVIKNPDYYFQSTITAARFFFGTAKYKIGVNPIIFDQNISDDALKGVLAHELVHTEDFREGTSLGRILRIGLAVMRPSKSRNQYERKTDLKTLLKGYSAEMIAYKSWQSKYLSEEARHRKAKEYLSIDEINFIESIKDQMPELMDKWLKKKIPTDLEEFKAEYRQAFEKSSPLGF